MQKDRGNPTCGFPSFCLLGKQKFTLSGAINDWGISLVATSDRGAASGHRKLFEKSLTKNFKLFFVLLSFGTFSFPKEKVHHPSRTNFNTISNALEALTLRI